MKRLRPYTGSYTALVTPFRRGAVAYDELRKLVEFQIKGGIDMHLLGSWGLGDRRYAMRELVYREMSEDAVDYQYMTGARLIGLLAKADQIMAAKNLYPNQGIDLSDEKDRDEKGDLIVPKTNVEK